MSADKKITLIITTKNGSPKLRTALQYYNQKRFAGLIIIADLSTGRSIRATRNVVEDFQHSNLNLKLECCPTAAHEGEAIKNVNKSIRTPYVMYCCDGDRAIKGGIIECVNVLDKNPSYVAAGGTRGTRLQCGDNVGIFSTRCLEVESHYVTERLLSYLRSRVCTIHYVHRVGTWRQMFKYANMIPNRWLATEVLPSCISVSSGRIRDALKQTKYSTLVRLHGQDSFLHPVTSLSDFCNDEYIQSEKIVKRIVLRYLIRGGLDPYTAEQFYNREAWLNALFVLLNRFVASHPDMKEHLDAYVSTLNEYPFEWKLDNLRSTLVCDPFLTALLKGGLLYGKSGSLG